MFSVKEISKAKQIKVVAKMEQLDQIIEFVMEELEYHHCPVKLQNQMALVIEELYTNIVNHAYQKFQGEVLVKCYVNEHMIKLVIIDNGCEFNPLSVPEPDLTAQAEKRNIGGLGIYLVKKNMDNINYQFQDGSNILTLLKKIS